MNLAPFRALLRQRLSDVLARNVGVSDHVRRAHGIPADWDERMVLLEDDAALAGLDPEARAEISAIRTSLARVEDGTYGTCARCGVLIGEARLRALPFVLTCVACSAG